MKKTHTILLPLTFLVSVAGTVLNAQWIPRNPGTTATLTDVAILDSVTAIVVGRDRSILKTSDGGVTWTNKAAHLSFAMPWNAVSFATEHVGIAVGDSGGIATSIDGGESWTWRTIPSKQRYLCALAFTGGHFYVGGDSGWVFSSSDSGNSWIGERASAWPILALFYHFTNAITVPIFALTPYSVCIQDMVSRFSWSENLLPGFGALGSAASDAEFGLGGTVAFVVGVGGDFVVAPSIFRKKTPDTTWQQIAAGLSPGIALTGVSVPSTTVVYVCGTKGALYKSIDAGDAWTNQSIQTARSLLAVRFINEMRGFAVGDSGLILSTSNGGTIAVGVQKPTPPVEFGLDQNYPNPFNPRTYISYKLPVSGYVMIRVYDVLGRQVQTLVNERQGAGTHTAIFDATGLSSGTYFYRLQVGGYRETKKLVVLW